MKILFCIIAFILAFIFVAGGIILIYRGIDPQSNPSIEGKYVDCYDRYENKIIGETCYDEPITNEERNAHLISLILIGCLFIWIGGYIIYVFWEALK